MMRLKWTATALLLVALAACSRGDMPSTMMVEVLQTSYKRVSGEPRDGAVNAAPAVTRAALQQLDIPLLEARIETIGQTAYLAPQRQRTDASAGAITVWRSGDDVTLTLRAGVLIATRGLKDDLLSASALVSATGREGPNQDGPRQLVFHHGANQERSFGFDCRQSRVGQKTVDVLGKAYATQHLRETCDSPGGQIQNDYWVDSKTGRLRQSRQWAGPTIGYIMLRVLEK